VQDVVHSTERQIVGSKVGTVDDVRKQKTSLVCYSDRRRKMNLELRDYLYKNLYYNPVVHNPNVRAVRLMEHMFKFYLAHPDEMGDGARKRIRKFGKYRAVCDYLAGMTDRYLVNEYNRLFGVSI
jgi:dGTPase